MPAMVDSYDLTAGAGEAGGVSGTEFGGYPGHMTALITGAGQFVFAGQAIAF